MTGSLSNTNIPCCRESFKSWHRGSGLDPEGHWGNPLLQVLKNCTPRYIATLNFLYLLSRISVMRIQREKTGCMYVCVFVPLSKLLDLSSFSVLCVREHNCEFSCKCMFDCVFSFGFMYLCLCLYVIAWGIWLKCRGSSRRQQADSCRASCVCAG